MSSSGQRLTLRAPRRSASRELSCSTFRSGEDTPLEPVPTQDEAHRWTDTQAVTSSAAPLWTESHGVDGDNDGSGGCAGGGGGKGERRGRKIGREPEEPGDRERPLCRRMVRNETNIGFNLFVPDASRWSDQAMNLRTSVVSLEIFFFQ